MAESSFYSMPDLVVEELFNKLSPVDRCTLATCSKRLLSFIDSPQAWRNVTFVLDMKPRNRGRGSRPPSEFIECLSPIDDFLTLKYKQHFRNVTIVISSGYIDRKTFRVLSSLCQRGVVKSVHIRVDQFLPNVYKQGGNVGEISLLCHDLFQPQSSGRPSDPPTIVSFIEQLEPGTDVAMTFPVWFENGPEIAFELFYRFECFGFDSNSNIMKLDSLLRKWILPTHCTYYNTHEIAAMISGFSSLQEIHVNISSLSDTLLAALSGHGVSKRRTPLRSLVIRHTKKERTPFPQLSSKAWLQLVQSSPSLTVECYVLTDSLPQLDNVLKAETPLVKIKVVCRSSDRQNMLMLYSLCTNHSSTLQHFHLSISHAEEGLHLSHAVKKALQDMVGACTKLQHLVLGVQTCCMTLVELATSGRQWRTFQYNFEAICCEDKVVCTDEECSELDCGCSGPLEYDRIEEATGFPYCAAAVEEVVDYVCPVDVFNSYSLQPEHSSVFSPIRT